MAFSLQEYPINKVKELQLHIIYIFVITAEIWSCSFFSDPSNNPWGSGIPPDTNLGCLGQTLSLYLRFFHRWQQSQGQHGDHIPLGSAETLQNRARRGILHRGKQEGLGWEGPALGSPRGALGSPHPTLPRLWEQGSISPAHSGDGKMFTLARFRFRAS